MTPLPRHTLLAASLVAFVALRFGDVLSLPFLFDDYAILEKVRARSPLQWWATRDLLYGWYRPWSRETHFGVLERLFGPNPVAFHAAGLLLWLACLVTFFALARRLSGERAAVIATCGLASLGAWSGTLLWAAGAQELWMLLFALLALHAFLARHRQRSTLALGGALVSKETAGVLPAVMALMAWWVQNDRARVLLRRVLLPLAVTVEWVVVHPTLRSRLMGHAGVAGEGASMPGANVALKTLGSFVNFERVPNPDIGVWAALLGGLPALLVLASVLAWNAWPSKSPEPALPTPHPRAAAWGLGWAVLAAAPLFAPGIVWASYYGLLAACGVWLAAGTMLAARPRVAAVLVLGVAALQPLQARTPAWEWGAHSFQARAAYFTSGLERSLRALHPTLPPHTRLYFADVPQSSGVGREWFNPVFHLWYRDTTLSAGFLSEYRMRGPAEPPGEDLFFRFEPPDAWMEIRLGLEDAARAEAANPRWVDDHRRLAVQLGLAGNWTEAAAELRKLASAHPEAEEFAANLAYALGQAGDGGAARGWK